jgi:uncharacterized protein (TIGR01244 family)
MYGDAHPAAAWHRAAFDTASRSRRRGRTILKAFVTSVVAAIAVVAGYAFQTPPQPSASAPQDVPPIRNFLQVTPQFCTGGQPRPEHFAKLKADGVKAVLNLRTPGEYRADEEQAAVDKAGMKYFNIPVVYTAPTDAQADEFLRITDEPSNRPMFIHCTAAIRVGAFWLIRRVMRDGMTFDAALEEAKKVGLNNAPHLEDFARKYIDSHKR